MAQLFRFRLKTVLKLRKQKEDEHKRIVAARVRELTAVRRRAERISRQIIDETQAVRAGRGAGVLSIQEIARHRHWLTHLQRSVLETHNQIRSVEALLAQDRAGLTKASREAKALEKLRDKQKRRHEEDERRRETRDLDEMAVLRFRPAAGTKPLHAGAGGIGLRFGVAGP